LDAGIGWDGFHTQQSVARRCVVRKPDCTTYELHKANVRRAPVDPSSDHSKAIECITAAYSSAEACNACADACLGEDDPALKFNAFARVWIVRTSAWRTAKIVSRMTATNKELVGAQLRACQTACDICAAESGKHGEHMEHCRICAEACTRCARACEALLNS
jgi:hypothetical protein